MRSSIVVFVLVFAVFGLLLGYAASDVNPQGSAGGPASSQAGAGSNGTQSGSNQQIEAGNSTANSTAQNNT